MLNKSHIADRPDDLRTAGARPRGERKSLRNLRLEFIMDNFRRSTPWLRRAMRRRGWFSPLTNNVDIDSRIERVKRGMAEIAAIRKLTGKQT